AYDIERNLRAPLVGIQRAGEREDVPVQPITIGVRTGDTSQKARRQMLKHPPDILVTTPESLFLFLGSGQRDILKTLETVIIDEIHAVAATKRGVHLALSMERLSAFLDHEPQRIGLSATQRPLDEIARFLGGGRPVTIIDTSEPPKLDLEIVVPVADMEAPIQSVTAEEGGPVLGPTSGGGKRKLSPSIWPALHPKLLELIRAHRTTILFVNSRLLCERLAQSLNELAGEELVRAHHGSIARAQREQIEDMLKHGQLPALVATSSLELGIDMGAVDLVIQIASPGSVARGLQRIGRAGHGVGEVSKGRIFPKFKGDLLETAVVARHMVDAHIESTRVPRNCLDVLAQHIVSAVAVDTWTVDEVENVFTRAYPYSTLTRGALISVLDMLSGRYPSDAFADLRPRITWDRDADTLVARKGAGMLALVNAGTIPDRGSFGVYLGDGGPKVGELDEEMVFESRRGDVVILGASSWRIQEITRDRVMVTPAPGEPGRLPFWKGDQVGRPVDLGRALGAFVREVGAFKTDETAVEFVRSVAPLDPLAAKNLVRYIRSEVEATDTLPTDRTLVVQRFRDELGDWRVCILSPFGARVHQPWALALEAELSARAGFDVQTMATDDGIVLRFADVEELPSVDVLFPDPEVVEDQIVEQLRHSAIFASRFRENAGRALLLPRRSPKQRRPLWQQRLKAQNLLAATRSYPAFPMVLETYRECLQDVFDVPALVDLLRKVRSRDVRVVEVETKSASPFARSLVFAYVAEYLYNGDAPLAERKAMALSLDRELLRELLGQEELRDLLDGDAVAQVELELQYLTDDRKVKHADAVHDLLRRLGDLSIDELAARSREAPNDWVEELVKARRVLRVRIAGEPRLIAVEDAGRYLEALGVVVPSGIASVFLEAPERPLESLLLRWARTHGPFHTPSLASRYGLRDAQVDPVLRALEHDGSMVRGELRPGGVGREWCEVDVVRRLRRRSLAVQRQAIEPVDAATYTRFLISWHGLDSKRSGSARLQEVLAQIEGRPLPFSALEKELLPARMGGFQPRMLDELGAMGMVVWIGCGALGSKDGRVALYRRERVPMLLDPPQEPEDPSELHTGILTLLRERGANFYVGLSIALDNPKDAELTAALWDLVWQGFITNDTFLPLRSLSRRKKSGMSSAAGGRWSLVEDLRAGAPSATARAHARANQLLERYGVVSREASQAEAMEGGFSAVYPVLRAMEDAGKVRRGWFVDGLTGAQFAQPGVVDRLRANRDDTDAVHVVAATDPANPYGAMLPWPVAEAVKAPQRRTGAQVVLINGAPILYVQPGSRGWTTLAGFSDPILARRAVDALCVGKYRTVRVNKIDGQPAREHPAAEVLRAAGFAEDYKGMLKVINA
ncbi:MAG: ATP-dependent Lhr-like helicase, partial [Myxococcota bacterium]